MGKKAFLKGAPAGGPASVAPGVAKPGKGKAAVHYGTTDTVKKSAKEKEKPDGGDFDLDALFRTGKAAKAKSDSAVAAAEALRVEKEGPALKEKVVLLPGQKKPKQQRVTHVEFVPVNQPRRFQDGLPVYKSYDDFSDVSCGQVAPTGAKNGKCPFECWCCF
jgi:hypothetical protein